MKVTATLGAGLIGLALAGCGGSALPPAQVTETQSAISAAEAVGAVNNPQAALHLKLANDQLQQAETLVKEGDDEEARLFLERAHADAVLAQTLTRREQEVQRTERAKQQVHEID